MTRKEELRLIEEFIAKNGVTKCPDDPKLSGEPLENHWLMSKRIPNDKDTFDYGDSDGKGVYAAAPPKKVHTGDDVIQHYMRENK